MTDLVQLEAVDGSGVRRVRLNRPEARNAQSPALLYALDAALLEAAQDPDTRVIVLSGNGPHFSSGHDLRDASKPVAGQTVGMWAEFEAAGCEGRLSVEEELYFGLCRRWRDLPKPLIAQVHGRVMAAGLMLAWCADLIVAADDTEFVDPVLAFGMPGVEYFMHPWELGARRAKKMLFTGESMSAREAEEIGMVAMTVPGAELERSTDEFARRIADKPMMALKLAKRSVNGMLDAQGQGAALEQAFAWHQLGHAHNQDLFGVPIDPTSMQAAAKTKGSATPVDRV